MHFSRHLHIIDHQEDGDEKEWFQDHQRTREDGTVLYPLKKENELKREKKIRTSDITFTIHSSKVEAREMLSFMSVLATGRRREEIMGS